MPLRRTVIAFVVTFACALAVFTLPRFAWNTLRGAPRGTQQGASVDTTASPPRQAPGPAATPAPPPRPLGPLPRGRFGLAPLLLLGVAVPSNHPKFDRHVLVWGL